MRNKYLIIILQEEGKRERWRGNIQTKMAESFPEERKNVPPHFK
jgi:hypothetical protein